MGRIKISAKFRSFLAAEGIDVKNAKEVVPRMHQHKQVMQTSSREEIAAHNAAVEERKKAKEAWKQSQLQ